MINAPAHTAEAPIYTVAKCLNELIVNKNFDEALEKIVQWLSISLEIDRCFIFENNFQTNSALLFKSFREGCEEGLGFAPFRDISFSADDLPEIKRVIERRQTVKVSINNIISPELRRLLEEAKLKSVLVMPVFSAGKVWGFIVFGDTKNTRTWRNSEQELQSLAAAIGVALENRKSIAGKNVPNEIFISPFSAIKEFAWEVDLLNDRFSMTEAPRVLAEAYNIETEVSLTNWFKENIHPEDLERALKKYEAFKLKDHEATEEDVFRLYNEKTDKYGWVLIGRKLFKNTDGIAAKITGTVRDISNDEEVAQELNKQREQYNFLVQNLGQVIFQLDNNGNCTFITNAWEELSGYKVKESLNSFFYNFFDDGGNIVNSNFYSLLSGIVDSIDLQLPLLKKYGQKTWVRLLARNTKDSKGNVQSIFGSLENINDKYATDTLLKESNEKLNTILNNSKEIILTINLDENVIENVNDAISILGYQPSEWIGLNYKNWSDNQRHKFHELMKLALKSNLQVSNQQITFANKENTELVPFEFSTSIFSFKNSKYLLCVLRDIRERLEYEKSINSISNQLSHLISNIDDVYAIYDLKTARFEFVSDNIRTLYECSKSYFISHGLTWVDIIHMEDVGGVLKQVQEIIERNHKGEFFYRINTTSGSTKMLLEKITVGKDKDGQPEKLYIVKTDYTHIKNAEQSLIETERKFKFISENISDFISIHDPDWNFTYASPSITNILGYETNDILGIATIDLVHPNDIARTLEHALKPIILEKKETQFRYRMKAKNGEFKWVETYSKPIINAYGETSSIISSTRDVTDQVNAEAMLKASEERYRLLSENSNDVIAILNADGQFNYVSPSCYPVLGYKPQELAGKNAVEVFANNAASKKMAEQGLAAISKERLGRKFIQNVKTKGGEKKSLEIWVQPIIKDNQVYSFQAASRDVTEREQLLSELEQSLAKERELNELRSMFVSTASHQFRTPLTVIQSGVEIMEMYLEDFPQEKQQRFQRQFNKIQGEIERLQHLMNDVLLLGRANAARTPFVPETADLVQFCRDIVEEKYNNSYPNDRRVLLAVEGLQQPVDFDTKLIGHAIENIISNAYKYSEEGNLFMNIAFKDEDVKISITDQGIGIPEEDLKNLFQPFYRATNTSEIEGTGLGLAIMKEFVDKHKGKIFVDSILNKGTTINVILPIKQKPE